MKKNCIFCKKVFEKDYRTSVFHFETMTKYCSLNCVTTHKKILYKTGIRTIPSRLGIPGWLKGKSNPMFQGENNPKWKGGKPNCPECGKGLARRESRYCVSCKAKLFGSGSDCNFYVDGRNQIKESERVLAMHTGEYQTWRRNNFTRDDFTCQICGVKGYLEVDHKVPWFLDKKRRYDLSNGITMCKECHLIKTFVIDRKFIRFMFRKEMN